jgi:hypothetical protein
VNIGVITINFALADLFSLLEADTVRSIKSLTEHVRERFFQVLCNGFVHRGLYVTPSSAVSTTGGTGDMCIRRIWNREFIAAALLAAEGDVDLLSSRFRIGVDIHLERS